MNTRERILIICFWSAVVALVATVAVACYVVKRDGVQGESFPPDVPASEGSDFNWFMYL